MGMDIDIGTDTEDRRALAVTERIAGRLLRLFESYHQGQSAVCDVGDLDAEERAGLRDWLGVGDVALRLDGEPHCRIQESCLAGLWWVGGAEAKMPFDGYIEVGTYPEVIRRRAHANSDTPTMPARADVPADLMNAPHVWSEILAAVGAFAATGTSHAINLDLLPLTAGDHAWLDQRLGEGAISAQSGGYGFCRVANTHIRHVWRVRHYNASGHLILNSLEVTDCPSAICATPEDIADSKARIADSSAGGGPSR